MSSQQDGMLAEPGAEGEEDGEGPDLALGAKKKKKKKSRVRLRMACLSCVQHICCMVFQQIGGEEIRQPAFL